MQPNQQNNTLAGWSSPGKTIMRKIINMGQAHGKRTFHVTGNPTWGDLIREGIIIAIPDRTEGIIYKRPENCTPVELAAKLTVEECAAITAAWNARLDPTNEKPE